jgi:hypothetical protein
MSDRLSISALRQPAVVLLTAAAFLNQTAGAQSSQAQRVTVVPAARTLRVVALEGEEAINSIPAHTATSPVVEVRDENERPVEGATVIFSLPETGAGGLFPGEHLTLTKVTNQRGQADATGFTPNFMPGRFLIRVTASHDGVTGTAFVRQTNTDKMPELRPHKSGISWKWIAVGAGAAAGAATGIYFGTRGSGPSSISAGAGPVVFGGPH